MSCNVLAMDDPEAPDPRHEASRERLKATMLAWSASQAQEQPRLLWSVSPAPVGRCAHPRYGRHPVRQCMLNKPSSQETAHDENDSAVA